MDDMRRKHVDFDICQVVSDMMVVDHHPSPPSNSFGSRGDMRTVQLATIAHGEIVLASRWSFFPSWKLEKSADGSVCSHNRQVRDAHQEAAAKPIATTQ